MAEILGCEANYAQNYLTEEVNMTDEQRAKAMFGGADAGEADYTVEGDTASFEVVGILRKNASPLPRYLGFNMTSYTGTAKKCREIQGRDDIKTVRVIYDTPGGYIDGLDEAWQAMADLAKSKTVIAEVRGMLCSAGYYLASPSSRIESSAPSNIIGSIGVVVVYTSWKEYDKKLGIKEIVIRSKNAPNKVPDPDSKEGRDIIQGQVNALERIFYQRIAEGRGISVETIAEKFGRGDVFVSMDPDSDEPDAIKAGMIDAVLTYKSKHQTNSQGSTAMLNEAQIKSAVDVIGGQYPQALKNLAEKVLCGESESASLSAAKAFWDARGDQAGNESSAALEAQTKAETDFQAEVAAARRAKGLPVSENQSRLQGNGLIETEADFETEVARFRANRKEK